MESPLIKMFNPQSIAAIGASDQAGSVGYALIRNLMHPGYKGKVFPVNPKHQKINDVFSYPSVLDIKEKIDLAVIATPARWVLMILEECGKSDIEQVVILSAGFKEAGEKGRSLFEQIKIISKKYRMRIMGPNCVGFINPAQGLNASFAIHNAFPGNLAFVSQSGALCTTILDWSVEQQIGFSYFISIGSMVDVDFDDIIDFLAVDTTTSCILIYMESLQEARKFMSAARAFARVKPIIILKAGKSPAGANAALSHTGAIAGDHLVYQTALQRAGIVEVNTIQELFDCAQAFATQPIPKDNRLAILSNAGGPAVLATDYLSMRGGILAKLSEPTILRIDRILENNWSRQNPIDTLGDVSVEQYLDVAKIMIEDTQLDAILFIMVTQAITNTTSVAEKLSQLPFKIPVFACWMGESDVQSARDILENGGIPNYRYPENAVEAFLKMISYRQNLKALSETPSDIPKKFIPNRTAAATILESVLKSDRQELNESEAKTLLKHYFIPTPQTKLVSSLSEAITYSEQIGFPVVLKVANPKIAHKSDIGGVVLNINTENELAAAYHSLQKKVAMKAADTDGSKLLIEPMIHSRHELFIGSKKDPVFGPVILFGAGGITVELVRDVAAALPPLNMTLAQRLIEKTNIYTLLCGYRSIPAIDLESLKFNLVKFAYLLADFPCIKEIDINPYAVNEAGGMALDAFITLEPTGLCKKTDNYSHLVISPYPTQYIRTLTLKNGAEVLLRPIKPEDELMEAKMFHYLSKKSRYFRYLGFTPPTDHENLIRFTQIDYDREIAIIAEMVIENEKTMVGLARLVKNIWNDGAEFAIVVADPWQQQGIGISLAKFMLQIAQDRNYIKIVAKIHEDNLSMHYLLEKLEFQKVSRIGNIVEYTRLTA